MPAESRHAALIFYVYAAKFEVARESIIAALRQSDDCDGEDSLDGSPFTVLKFRSDRHSATSVALVFVHLTEDEDYDEHE